MTHAMSSDEVVSRYKSAARRPALPRHCSNDGDDTPLDTVLFDGAATAIGEFRCPMHQPSFRDSGPIARSVIVFPRTSVWIKHEGGDPFVADANVVTIYNRGQRYERSSISADGDRCDWLAVSDDLARDIAAAFAPAIADSVAPAFRFERAPSTPALYLAQRRLTRRAARGDMEPLEMEETVIDIVSQVLGLAYQGAPGPLVRRAAQRHRELTEHAKAELLRTITVNRSASDIARAVQNVGIPSVSRISGAHRAYHARLPHRTAAFALPWN